MTSSTPRTKFDIVLYGATGFVGRLTARHVSQTAAGVRVALAGRDRDQLEALQRDLDVDWPVLVVGTGDAAGLEALASSTRAVASAVGRHGMPLALACARAGTSYADLSGEVPFVRRSIDVLHDVAASTGARVVHGCGFDAVPSDLSTYLLADAVRASGQGSIASRPGAARCGGRPVGAGRRATRDTTRNVFCGCGPDQPWARGRQRRPGRRRPALPSACGQCGSPSPRLPPDA